MESKMIYKIYHDRIVLADDDDLALAEVDFPAIEGADHTVEITHTVVDESLQGQGIAGKLMLKLTEYLRKNHLTAIPSCSYAVKWFQKHPEASDVLSRDYMPELEDMPAAPRPKQTGNPAGGQGQDPYVHHPDPASVPYPGAYAPAPRLRRTAPEYTPAYKETESGMPRNVAGTVMGVITRGLQLLCAFFLALIFIIYTYAVLLNLETLGQWETMVYDKNIAEMTFCGISGGILLIFFIEFFWMLTRKKVWDEDGSYRIDSGRGITAFVLVLFFYLLGLVADAFVTGDGMVLSGILAAAETYLANGIIIRTLGIAGLILSIIRKVIGH